MRRLEEERGFVLVTAMVVLMIFLMLGLAIMETVNVQTSQTGYEKAGEAAFNLAESALQAEAYQLQVAWPTTSAEALGSCNQSTPQALGCEGVALTSKLSSAYAGSDYAGATWKVQVFDDNYQSGASYYSDTLASSAPSWDSNGDGLLWVRAQATSGRVTRTVVEQVVRRSTVLTVPQNTVTAGSVYTDNDGSKVIIQAHDNTSGLTGNVDVRCGNSATVPKQGAGNCLGWDAGKGQLSPSGTGVYQAGYTDPGGAGQTLDAAQLGELKQTAITNNTYYNGQCPPDGTSGVVYVENVTSCSFTGNATWNSATSPGALILPSGTVSFGGTETFYGVVYDADQQGTAPPCTAGGPSVVSVGGNVSIVGAVFVDGCGAVELGASGNKKNPNNLTFASNALNALVGTEPSTLAQNTFRILQ